MIERPLMFFDACRFLHDNFQTPEGVIAACAGFDMPTPSLEAVTKWFQRGNVPGQWLAVLLMVIETEYEKVPSMLEYWREEGRV